MENLEIKKQEYKEKYLIQKDGNMGLGRKPVYLTKEHFEAISSLSKMYGLNISQFLKNILEEHLSTTKEVRKGLYGDAILECIDSLG